MPSRHNGTEKDESNRVTRYKTIMQQNVFHLFLSEADSPHVRISGNLLGESVDSKGQLVFQGCIIPIRW